MKLFDFIADLRSHKLLGNINIVPCKSPARIRFEHEEITAILRIEDVNRSDFWGHHQCVRSLFRIFLRNICDTLVLSANLCRKSAMFAVSHDFSCTSPPMRTETIAAGDMQKKAPQPSERPVSAKVAGEFLQMHARSVHAACRSRTHPRPSHRLRTTQEMSLLHLGTRRMVAGSDILRGIPASSRQRRTSCVDETVISSEVSNFAKGLKARTHGYSVTGTDRIHHRRDPQ